MITFISITTSLVSFALLAKYAYRCAHLNESLRAENALRKGCQIQLEERDGRIRDLESVVRRVRWEGEQDCKNKDETLSSLREDLRASRKLNKEKDKVIEGYIFSDITSIKFTAHVPDAGWKRTEFKLGLGSCGKEVTCLHWKELEDRYELTQTCTDGERKEFTYYRKDVAGRIEIAYKVANNTTH
ncbi:hypothetical protein LPST144_orf00006 [Salmonella phage LPST144]|nr:hypothetical protein LPST144_orf00006 [Salmonella phage LPST144]